jgi:hypothetical protein
MLKLKYFLFMFVLTLATPVVSQTQTAAVTTTEEAVSAGNSDVEMAETLRRDGKIYVVVAVIITVLAGLIIYLVRLDSKVSKLEKQLKS